MKQKNLIVFLFGVQINYLTLSLHKHASYTVTEQDCRAIAAMIKVGHCER